jgi:hypothetical protein
MKVGDAVMRFGRCPGGHAAWIRHTVAAVHNGCVLLPGHGWVTEWEVFHSSRFLLEYA